jgi:hypothetical protein
MTPEVLFDNSVFIILFSDTLLLILTIIATLGSIQILKHWDFHATTPQQYTLEKKSYLITLIISITLIFNILLLPYFAYTLESLSDIVPGAMCAAGVIDANQYGNPLLILRIFTLFLVGVWLIINQQDLQATNYPYTKKKFGLFLFIALLIAFSFILEIAYFSHISLEKPVACCSVIFGFSGTNSLPFALTVPLLLGIFYLLFLLNLLFIWQEKPFFLALSSLAFLYIGYLSLIHFFGTYIYQLPTHICPFCMLQGAYYYIGYLLWGLLFVGVFFGIANGILKPLIGKTFKRFYHLALTTQLLFIMITAGYVIVYLLKNKVWL